MIRVSVVSTKDTFKLTSKCLIILVTLILTVIAIKTAKTGFNSSVIPQGKSYLYEEITLFKGGSSEKHSLNINVSKMLDSELRLSSYLKEQSEVEVDDTNQQVAEERITFWGARWNARSNWNSGSWRRPKNGGI